MTHNIMMMLAAIALAGCAHTAGYAGDHPSKITCHGKGAITGTGSATGTGIVGVSGNNAWTIQADCGDGFTYQQGPR